MHRVEQPRSQGLSSSHPLERDGKKRDIGNEVESRAVAKRLVTVFGFNAINYTEEEKNNNIDKDTEFSELFDASRTN